jgi:hypothetical protein
VGDDGDAPDAGGDKYWHDGAAEAAGTEHHDVRDAEPPLPLGAEPGQHPLTRVPWRERIDRMGHATILAGRAASAAGSPPPKER